MNQTKNPHWRTTLDAFLDGEGIRETAKDEAVTRSLSGLVQRRVASDARFAGQLLCEAIDTMLTGDVETGKAILCD